MMARYQAMKRVLPGMLAAFAVFAGCVAGAQAGDILFCPPGDEEGTRRVLGIENRASIGESEFLALVAGNGLTFEERSAPYYVPRKCGFSGQLEVVRGYKVYAGWDEKQTHTRNYLVLVGSDNQVTHIVSRPAYKDPVFKW